MYIKYKNLEIGFSKEEIYNLFKNIKEKMKTTVRMNLIKEYNICLVLKQTMYIEEKAKIKKSLKEIETILSEYDMTNVIFSKRRPSLKEIFSSCDIFEYESQKDLAKVILNPKTFTPEVIQTKNIKDFDIIIYF